MARPSQAVRKLRRRIERRRFERSLNSSKKQAKREQRRDRIRKNARKKVAPARIEAKATKQEVGKLASELKIASSGTRRSASSVGRGASDAVKTAASLGSDIFDQIPDVEAQSQPVEPPEFDPVFDDATPSLVFGPNEESAEPPQRIEFGMDGSPSDFDMFVDADGGGDPMQFF